MPGAAAPAFKTKFLVIVLVFVQGYIFPPGVRPVDTSVLGLRSEWEGTLPEVFQGTAAFAGLVVLGDGHLL